MPSEGLLSRTLKKTGLHSAVYGLGMSFTAISGIVLVPVYTRFLSPSDYGVYSLISIISSLLLFLYDFGMINAIFRWYYQYSPEEIISRRRVINTAFAFLATIATAFTMLLCVASPLLSRAVFSDSGPTDLLRLMLFGVLFQSLTWVPLSVLRIKERVGAFLMVTLTMMAIMIFANYVLLSLGHGLYAVYEASIATYLFTAAALFYITRDEYSADLSLRELKGMLKFGLPYLPVLFFSWIIDFSDRYLLGKFSTLQDVGLYSVGYRVGQVMYMAEKAFLVAWVPLMLSIYQQHKAESPRIFGGVFTYFVSFIIFLGLCISVFSPEIIRIFTSRAYSNAAFVVPWISLAYLFSGIYIFMLSGFIISKNVVVQPVILSVSAAVNIALNIVLIPRIGMMGAAYSTVISYLIVAAATLFFAQKLYPIDIDAVRLSKLAVCSFVLYLLSLSIKTSGIMTTVLLKGVLISTLFVFLYFARFYSPDEIRTLRGFFLNRGAVNNA